MWALNLDFLSEFSYKFCLTQIYQNMGLRGSSAREPLYSKSIQSSTLTVKSAIKSDK